jgi:large subunit ribosomal protein L6
MIAGVSKGFEKNLVIVGVGYRAQKVADKLVLQVGHTHRVEISPPAGISFALEGANRIKVIGVDKELVGDVAAKIRAIRPPDAYKGKGIRYQEERIHLKAGKGGRVAGKRK